MTFFILSLNASNEYFIWFWVDDAPFLESRTVYLELLGFFFFLDNEGIQEDPARIGREGQNKKVWEDCEKTLKASRRFLSPCRVWKLIRNLMKKTSSLGFLEKSITEAPGYKVISVLQSWISLSHTLKMSSQAWSPIVGFYGMLCVWAAWLSGSGAVLSPNGTIFEDRCKKTTTCEVLKYNTCLGSPLPYTHTSLILAEDSSTQEEAYEKLTMWSGEFYWVQIKYKRCSIAI